MLELEHGFRVVDVHARLEPDERRRSRGRRGDPEALEREMHQAGIVRSLAFPPAREGSYLKANNGVARMCVDRPFVALARLNGSLDPGAGPTARLRNLAASREERHVSPDDVEQYAYDDRFAGFTLAPAIDGLPDAEVLDRLAEVGLPLVVRGGEGFPPAAVAETLLDRSLSVVLAGFGGYPLNRDLMDRAIGLLDRYESCFLDTSFVPFRDPMERAMMEHPDRVCFGSGAPASHPNVGVMSLLTLDVPQDAMKKAFSKNASRVFPELGP